MCIISYVVTTLLHRSYLSSGVHLPTHSLAVGPSLYPSGHWHSKEPGVFTHWEMPRHGAGMRRHSLSSGKYESNSIRRCDMTTIYFCFSFGTCAWQLIFIRIEIIFQARCSTHRCTGENWRRTRNRCRTNSGNFQAYWHTCRGCTCSALACTRLFLPSG